MKKYSRRNSTPLDSTLVKAFHGAIEQGDLDEVRAQLAAHPRLANTKEVKTGVTSLMKSSVAPNAIALMTLLRQQGANLATRDATRRTVLLYACTCGAEPATVDLLWSWSSLRPSPDLRWTHCDSNHDGAMVLAVRSRNVALLHHLWSIVPISAQSNASNHSLKQLKAAISTNDEDFIIEVMRNPLIQQAVKDEDEFEYEYWVDDWSSSDANTHDIKITVACCIKNAIDANLRRVVDLFERINPGYTHATLFYYCHTMQPCESAEWSDFTSRYVWESSQDIVRPALLVQRQWLPGLVPLGHHIASYLMPLMAQVYKRAQIRINDFEISDDGGSSYDGFYSCSEDGGYSS
ncbi:hypothetical protein B5M09_000791 [Aphanomyces astaci]|uniref:Uncharacterized protein n=1 Tax=Aphanomyces astaci TaxID=112090 RepID=A0A425D7G2_APHAT|nr:hypothetical protein B5M09_000791 [Aphanomyces astaci]